MVPHRAVTPLVQTKKTNIFLLIFANIFFAFSSFFAQKTTKKHLLTSVWSTQTLVKIYNRGREGSQKFLKNVVRNILLAPNNRFTSHFNRYLWATLDLFPCLAHVVHADAVLQDDGDGGDGGGGGDGHEVIPSLN